MTSNGASPEVGFAEITATGALFRNQPQPMIMRRTVRRRKTHPRVLISSEDLAFLLRSTFLPPGLSLLAYHAAEIYVSEKFR